MQTDLLSPTIHQRFSTTRIQSETHQRMQLFLWGFYFLNHNPMVATVPSNPNYIAPNCKIMHLLLVDKITHLFSAMFKSLPFWSLK